MAVVSHLAIGNYLYGLRKPKLVEKMEVLVKGMSLALINPPEKYGSFYAVFAIGNVHYHPAP